MVGVAVNVTLVPAQMVVVGVEMLTEATRLDITASVMVTAVAPWL